MYGQWIRREDTSGVKKNTQSSLTGYILLDKKNLSYQQEDCNIACINKQLGCITLQVLEAPG